MAEQIMKRVGFSEKGVSIRKRILRRILPGIMAGIFFWLFHCLLTVSSSPSGWSGWTENLLIVSDPQTMLFRIVGAILTAAIVSIIIFLQRDRRRFRSLLGQSREAWRLFFENAPVGFLVLDSTGNIQSCNIPFLDYTQRDKDELIGHNLGEFLAAESKAYFEAIYADTRPERQMLILELIRKDGTVLILSLHCGAASINPVTSGERHCVAHDITDQKKIITDLRESESKYRTLFEGSSDGFLMLGDLILDCNDQLCHLFGCMRGEIIGHHPAELSPEYQPDGRLSWEAAAAYIAAARKGEVQIFNWQHRHRDGTILDCEITLRALKIKNSAILLARVHDITAKKKIEQALLENERNLKGILAAAPIGIGLVVGRVFRWVNQNIVDMLGYSPEELIGQSARMIYPDDAEFIRVGRDKYADVEKTGMGEIETRWKCKDGRIIDIHLRSTAIDHRNLSAGVIFTAIDITERKRTTRGFKESEERFRALAEQNVLGIVVIQSNVIKYANQAISDMAQKPLSEIIDRNFPDIAQMAHPDDREYVFKLVSGMQEGNEADDTAGHFRIITPANQTKWLEHHSRKIAFEGSQALLIAITDITARRESEGALQTSENKYRQLIETLNEGIWVIDKEGNTSFVNSRMAGMLGYTKDEMLGQHLFTFMDEQGVEICKKYLEKRQQGIREQHDFEFVRKDDTRLYAMVETSPIIDAAGNYQGAIAGVLDITARKQAEDALRESEEKWRSLVQNAPDFIATINSEGRFLFVNQVAKGTNTPNIIGRSVFNFTQESDADYIKNILKTVFEDQMPCQREAKIVRENGSEAWYIGNFAPIKSGDKVTSAIFIAKDITEQKKMELELRERTERYWNLYNNADVGLFRSRISDGKVIESNDRLAQMFGYSSRDEFLAEFYFPGHYVSIDDRTMLMQVLDRDGAADNFESAFRRRDGSVFWVRGSGRINRDGGYIEGMVTDITERKRAEDALQEERSLFMAGPVVVFKWPNRSGTPTDYVSGNIATQFGYSAEDLTGERINYMDIIHPDDRERIRAESKAFSAAGREWFEQMYRIRRADGEYRWIHDVTHVVRDASGNILHHYAYIVDITERKHAEESLLESTALLNESQRLSRAGGWQYEVATGRMSWTDELYRLHEFPPDLDMGTAIQRSLDCYEKEDRDRIKRAFEEAVTNGKSYDLEARFRTPSGKQLWVRTAAEAVMQEGKVVKIVGTMMDITERKRTELQFHVQRDYSLALSATASLESGLLLSLEAALAVSEMDCGGLYLIDDEAGALLLACHKGLSPEFVERVRYLSPATPNTQLVLHGMAVYSEHLKLGTIVDDIKRRENLHAIAVVPIHHDNRVIGCMNVASHTLDEVPRHDREALEIIAAQIGNAIARLKAEEEKRESMERFRTLVESTSEVVWEVNQDGICTYVSPRIKDLLGYKPSEVIGKSPFDFMTESDAEKVGTVFRQKAAAREPFRSLINTNIHKDGRLVVLETSGIPVIDATGRLTGYRGIDRDITEKRRIEEELAKADKLESIGLLAGGIAHDFNNILTSVVGNISLAKMAIKNDDEITARLEDAEKASQRARDLTHQLLTFAKGGIPHKKIADVSGLIEETSRFALRGSNVRCHYRLSPDLHPVEIDEGQISQVINNLIINADQAMPNGGIITITAQNVDIVSDGAIPLRPGPAIMISITDQGPGIPEQYLTKIFDPFFTTKPQGTGLGLPTAYSVIRRHDGHIKVHSDVGRGTTFSIYLPATDSSPESIERTDETVFAGEGRILIMDDDESVRAVAGIALTGLGYKVSFAGDGAEAVEIFDRERAAGKPFDAVILDLTVPGAMGGKEALSRMLEIDPQTKAIVSSGYSDDNSLADFDRHGFKGFVPKPYNVPKLSRALHEVLHGRQPQEIKQTPILI